MPKTLKKIPAFALVLMVVIKCYTEVNYFVGSSISPQKHITQHNINRKNMRKMFCCRSQHWRFFFSSLHLVNTPVSIIMISAVGLGMHQMVLLSWTIGCNNLVQRCLCNPNVNTAHCNGHEVSEKIC